MKYRIVLHDGTCIYTKKYCMTDNIFIIVRREDVDLEKDTWKYFDNEVQKIEIPIYSIAYIETST